MTLFISIPTRIEFDKTTNLPNYFELNDYGNFEFESIIIFIIIMFMIKKLGSQFMKYQ